MYRPRHPPPALPASDELTNLTNHFHCKREQRKYNLAYYAHNPEISLQGFENLNLQAVSGFENWAGQVE